MFGKHYKTPSGSRYRLFCDMAKQTHLLIAGETGSGKSVVVNGIMTSLLYNAPCETGFILIDPKRTELWDYSNLPHTLRYATEYNDIISALQYALQIIDSRFVTMRKRHEKISSEGDIYIVIDELAFLLADPAKKRVVLPMLQRIGIIARAAKIHMIACTQTVKASILSTPLTCNFDSRLALRTVTAQQSRMILERSGCELLPRYGQGYLKTPEGTTLYNIPMYPETETARLVDWWTSRKCIA